MLYMPLVYTVSIYSYRTVCSRLSDVYFVLLRRTSPTLVLAVLAAAGYSQLMEDARVP